VGGAFQSSLYTDTNTGNIYTGTGAGYGTSTGTRNSISGTGNIGTGTGTGTGTDARYGSEPNAFPNPANYLRRTLSPIAV